jgi:choline dehydrogenase-like flavoprotein
MSTTEVNRHVVVIGSGPSGAMAALTLVQRGVPVTLLESGQALPRGALVRVMGGTLYRKWPVSAHSQRHSASGDPSTLWFNDLVPGGLSNYWTGAVPRFAPEDFSEGERLHERYRWPITYNEIAPYYTLAEQRLIVTAGRRSVPNLPASDAAYHRQLAADWRRIEPAAETFGSGLVPTPLSEGPPWLVRRQGASFNSFVDIVLKLQQYPHFKLLLGAHALRLEWNGATRRVDHIVYLDRSDGVQQRIAAAAVVLGAGPLASTKLLLDSVCADFPDGLGNTDGLLGHYLHDHVSAWRVIEVDRPLTRLRHTVYLTRAPYRDAAPLYGASCTIGNAAPRDRILALTPTKAHQFGVVTFGTMVPLEENHVRLDTSQTNEFGLPLLNIHLNFDKSTRDNVAAAQERLLTILEAAGSRARMVTDPHPLVPGWAVHFGGTVRMHASPRYGMLNAWNRLHAIKNVVVVDASSFTTGVEKNPTLTVMALAARAAERLAQDLDAGDA